MREHRAVDRPLRLVVWNTFLLPGLGRGDRGWLGSRLASRRAGEVGAALGADYDVAALSEVWRAADRERLRGAWASVGGDPQVIAGVDGPGELLRRGSGLATVVDGPAVVRTERLAYRAREPRHRGIDAWQRKGALAVAIAGPDGRELEVISTHLAIGGWLDPGEDHRRGREVRRGQIAELVAFARGFHRDPATLLVVGDLNVIAGTEEYDDLCAALGELGLVDWWPLVGSGPGATHDPGDPGSAIRIDHAFGPPPATSPLVPTVLCTRRFPWPNAPSSPADQPRDELSDHLALHLELAPR